MKIITWNINGLRAMLKKGSWDWVAENNFDAVCLQEIKARPDQLTAEQHALFSPLEPAWHPAERPGYSGVVTLTHPDLAVTHINGMDHPDSDHEGRVIQTVFPDFRLFNIYFPNGGRDLLRVPYKLEFYAHLLNYCDKLHTAGEQIIICGDLNTSHQEIDLKNPKSNQNHTGFLPEERAWIDKYLSHGLVDAYRSLYPDKVQYTWWANWGGARSRNVGWRLDYFMVSEGLMPQVKDVIIHDQILVP